MEVSTTTQVVIALVILMPIAVVAFFGVMRFVTVKEGWENEAIEKINIIIDDTLRISPEMKESLKQFTITHASGLRSMNRDELENLLLCSSDALKVFERRVERISEGYAQYENIVDGIAPISTLKHSHNVRKTKKEQLAPVKARLDKQAEQVVATFDDDLKAEGSVLNIIPEKYRLSTILEMMCGYLSEGEADSWEGCIKTFKDDTYKMRMEGHLQNFSNSLKRIERNTSAIAFFSAVTALNTL